MKKSDQPFSLGDGSSAEQLEGVVREYEALNEDGAAIAKAKGEIRKAAKDAGFDWPTIADLIKRRELTTEEVIEADQLLETYEIALGCGAAAVGVLSSTRNASGVFEIKMVSTPVPDDKLTRRRKAQRDAVAMAELARQARSEGA